MTDNATTEAIARLRAYVNQARAMRGWDWKARISRVGPDFPWDYMRLASGLLRKAQSVLDMGTGGGESFGSLIEHYKGRAVATEEWLPNVPVAAHCLTPQGASVVRAASLQLPFADGSFELVLSRHEELDCAEVARVLRRGGHVLTQQVGRTNWDELREFFPRMVDFGPLFERYREGFISAGLTITRAESAESKEEFAGLGDVVYALVVTPWSFPEFSLDRDIDALLALERGAHQDEGIVLTESRFVIEAEKTD